MQIIIDIPEDLYEECTRLGDSSDILFEAIRKGKILPEGHGRLIDADKLRAVYTKPHLVGFDEIIEDIDEQPTVVEGEKNEAG